MIRLMDQILDQSIIWRLMTTWSPEDFQKRHHAQFRFVTELCCSLEKCQYILTVLSSQSFARRPQRHHCSLLCPPGHHGTRSAPPSYTCAAGEPRYNRVSESVPFHTWVSFFRLLHQSSFCCASSSGAEPFFFVFARFICIQMMLCSLPLSSSLLVSCLWVMSLWESGRGWKV